MFINIKATLTQSAQTRELTFVIWPFRLIKHPETLPILQHLVMQTSRPRGSKFFERSVEFGVADRTAGGLIQDTNLEPQERARRIVDTGALAFAAYSKMQAMGLVRLKSLVDSNCINASLKLPNCANCQRVKVS